MKVKVAALNQDKALVTSNLAKIRFQLYWTLAYNLPRAVSELGSGAVTYSSALVEHSLRNQANSSGYVTTSPHIYACGIYSGEYQQSNI